MRLLPVLIGGGALLAVGGVAYAASKDKADRKIWLINGKRYNIVARMSGPGWDASMFPGFCNFTSPIVSSQWGAGERSPAAMTEVNFSANWCAANTQWSVPDNIAIAEA